MSAPTRPVLRYHGGKWRLAPWIIEHLPRRRVYVEPFGGGASVLMRKPRSYSEVYNDLDGEIVNLFRVMRDEPNELLRRVQLTPFSRGEFRESYEPSDDPIEQARRTLFRAQAGHGSTGSTGRNTGFRANVTRSSTTPAHDWRRHADTLPPAIERMRGVIIENAPAAEVVERYDSPDTLFYVDPPYPLLTRTNTAKWDMIYRHEMTDDQHRELAEQLHQVEGAVVLSGYPCDLYDLELYPDWLRLERRAHTDARLERVEVLWLNPAAHAAQPQRSLFA